MDRLQFDTTGVLIVCERCGQRNRIRFESLDRGARCGKCQADVPPPASPVEVRTAEEFAALIDYSALPVLVDFWAAWCAPCRMVAPELAKVATSHAGRIVVAKLDTDALSDVATRLGIQSIPTMALFHGGRELARTSGARPAAAIAAFVDQAHPANLP
ncbi:MAG TPA: thioredoxin [Vicinamibacterales bacterium]|nr:thioredoxin [Vicinamibacterales bacterium]